VPAAVSIECVSSSGADLIGKAEHVLERPPLASDPLLEQGPVDELQDQRGRAVVFLEPIDGRHVRVVECGEEPALALEARTEVRSLCQPRGQRLERHLAREPRVAGAVHLAHTAGAEQPEDLVRAEM
jgi:hypothetical protein